MGRPGKSLRGAIEDAAAGLLAGAGATLAMTAAMLVFKQLGAMSRTPPVEIAARSTSRICEDPRPSAPVVNAAASAAHVGFGALAGGIFAVLHPRLVWFGPPVVRGALFGVVVWLVSYFGWLPAARLMPPAQRDEPGRQPAMLAAHLVYGGALALLTSALRRPLGDARKKR